MRKKDNTGKAKLSLLERVFYRFSDCGAKKESLLRELRVEAFNIK